jgi:hypothetical protein
MLIYFDIVKSSIGIVKSYIVKNKSNHWLIIHQLSVATKHEVNKQNTFLQDLNYFIIKVLPFFYEIGGVPHPYWLYTN